MLHSNSLLSSKSNAHLHCVISQPKFLVHLMNLIENMFCYIQLDLTSFVSNKICNAVL